MVFSVLLLSKIIIYYLLFDFILELPISVNIFWNLRLFKYLHKIKIARYLLGSQSNIAEIAKTTKIFLAALMHSIP